MLESAIFFNEQPRTEMRAFVTAHADYQTKYLVHGGPVERWPQPIKTTPATPELLRSAATTLSFFELVGRTEELGAFVARLAALLGVTPPSGGSSSSGSNGGDAQAAAPMLGQAHSNSRKHHSYELSDDDRFWMHQHLIADEWLYDRTFEFDRVAGGVKDKVNAWPQPRASFADAVV